MSTLFASIAAALYLAATIRYQRSLYASNGSDENNQGRGFVIAAFVAQLVSLYAAGREMHACPLNLAQSLNLICCAMVGLYIVVSTIWKMEVVGAFAAPAASLVMLASLATERLRGPDTSLRDPMLTLHVAAIVLGYAAFLLASIVAALYFFQTFLLKRKLVTGLLTKLPSLDNLDQVTYRLIAVGFLPMIAGIALGYVRAVANGSRFWSFDVMLGIFTVIVYAVYISARLVGGWGGRRINGLLLVGFFFLIATYVGVGLPSGVHAPK